MSTNNSNPGSDFDFAELQNENDAEEMVIDEASMMKSNIQKIDVNLLLLLNKFNLPDEIISNFGMYHIRLSQLNALTREDLEKLGIVDNKVQNDMLDEFQNLPNQDPTLQDSEQSSPAKKDKSIVDTLQDHLYQMNTLLAAVCFQLGATSSSSSGVIINQRFCSTQVVLELLGQLSHHTAQMEEIIKVLKDPTKYELTEKEFEQKKMRERQIKCVVFVSGLGLFVAGIFWAKRLGLRNLF